MRPITFRRILFLSAALIAVGSASLGSGAGGSVLAPPRSAHASGNSYVPYVVAGGQIPSPPWWVGSCDAKRSGADPNSAPLGAAWDGLVACGPGPNEGGYDSVVNFFPGSWGEYEWECVELSMRWMYLAWGVPPYPANGDQVVDNYAKYNPSGPKLTVVKNGTRGVAPQPGDVLELNDGDAFGHTEVVTASAVGPGGNGTVRVITENLNSPTDGWQLLSVNHWVVDGGFGTVVDWLHNPAWSHQEPLVGAVDPNGHLLVKQDGLRGGFRTIRTGPIAHADVIGGGGAEPEPLMVVLTTKGQLEAAYDLPYLTWVRLATGVKSFSATSGEGPGGGPTIGWLTNSGAFYVISGSLSSRPVLESSHAISIAVGSDSNASSPLLGYIGPAHHAFVRFGSGPFKLLASDAAALSLAADGLHQNDVLEGYVDRSDRAFYRLGAAGPLTSVGSKAAKSVSQLSLSLVGTSAKPLIAYLTPTGEAYASLGGASFVHELSHATHVEVASGRNSDGYLLFGVESSNGTWLTKSSSLSSPFISQGRMGAVYLSPLVVS